MLAGPLLGMPLALLPGQLLWINLLTHGIPGVALGAEPAEADVLRRKPRSPQESVLGDGLLVSVLARGLCLATVVLAAGVVADRMDLPWQSVMFVVLGLAQLGVALAVRAKVAPGVARNLTSIGASDGTSDPWGEDLSPCPGASMNPTMETETKGVRP